MKFIGQHIVDLIARFRSLIYLENLGSSSDEEFLVVDSDGKVTKNTSTISTIRTNITDNTTNISSNDTDISTNATNIATNTSNIATNSSDIAVLQSSSGDSPAIIDSSPIKSPGLLRRIKCSVSYFTAREPSSRIINSGGLF